MLESDLLKPTSERDKLSTVDSDGNRKWQYVAKPDGQFYTLRKVIAAIFIISLFVIPFLKYNDMPVVLLNVVEGKFIIFTKIFWPNDFFLFAFGMIIFIIFIILFTIAYGRLFCGWICPQTIFMEFVFRRIEWFIEGSPSQQKKLNEQEWNREKILKKTTKHLIFLIISFVIAHTFLSYIIGIDELLKIIREPLSQNFTTFLGLIIFTLLFYGVFAFVREIVCTTICPYGRLQSVLYDKDTMQIAYDYLRGEPRGKMAKNNANVLGDCIDCKKCVHVCPTGIDIRNGVQLDCVGCTACIDACDEVMVKINRPKGLIRYASENEISISSKWTFTPRLKAYTALLSILMTALAIIVITRDHINTTVVRTGGTLYQKIENYGYSNLYTAKIINKTNKDIPIHLSIENIPTNIKLIGTKDMILKAEKISMFTFMVEIEEKNIKQHSTKLKVNVIGNKDNKILSSYKTNFLGPFL